MVLTDEKITFDQLKLSSELVKALNEDKIIHPTAIQEKAIPLALDSRDVIGISRTGSGKTLAFGAPMIELVEPGKGIQGLVLAPTRELAVQISGELRKFSKYMPRKVATVYGGVALGPQIEKMKEADIVVATPGRILDHLQRRTVEFPKVRIVILDEADKMVDMGFIEDVDKIVSQAKNKKQMMLFGATISHEIEDIKRKHMHNSETVKAMMNHKEDVLEQYYYDVNMNEKFSLLVHLLKTEKIDRAIIFCAVRTNVESVTLNLRRQGFKVEMIHGKLNQNRRLRVMEGFNKGNPNILVASAVAARGLDIKYVTHIFNYGLSQDPQEYIHRIGRTARAGETGKAITLLSERDHEAFGAILRTYDVKVKKLHLGKFPKVAFNARIRDSERSLERRGGSFGRGFRGQGGRHRDNGRGRSGSDRQRSRGSSFGRGAHSGGRGSRRSNANNSFDGREGRSMDSSMNDQPRIKNWRDAV